MDQPSTQRDTATHRLADAIQRRLPEQPPATCIEAAARLLSRSSWQTLRAALANHLLALSTAYRAQEDGRSHAFARAAEVARRASTFAAYTRAHGIGPELRAEAAAFAAVGEKTPRARSVVF